MAVPTFDNATYSASGSYSHTTSTGTNRGMVVFQKYTGSGQYSSITYNSVSLTRITQDVRVGTSGDYQASFYLNAPATGANTLALSGGTNVATCTLTYTDVKQSGQPESNSGGSGQTTTSTGSTTVTIAHLASLVVVGLSSQINDPTSISGWTSRGTPANHMKCGDINGQTIATGSTSYTATFSGATDASMAALEVNQLDPVTTISDTNITTESTLMGVISNASDTNVTTDSGIAKIGWGTSTKSASTWTTQNKS